MSSKQVPGDLQTISEFLALVDLEPELRYVFVEGNSDVAVVDWYVTSSGLDASVLAISSRLFVPRDEVPDPENYGERDKLDALADRVSVELPSDQTSITVVLDADWITALGPEPISRGCRLYTDFPSMEFYSIEGKAFERLVRLGFERQAERDVVCLSLHEAMVKLASARLVLRELRVSCTPSYIDLCQVGPGVTEVDVREILRRSLTHVPSSERPESIDGLRGWALKYETLLREAGHLGRGHDLAPMLIKYFALNGREFTPALVERLMRTALRQEELREYEMFAALERRLAA